MLRQAVKHMKEIDVSEYKTESYEGKRVYLYSNLGYFNETKIDNKNLKIIDKIGMIYYITYCDIRSIILSLLCVVRLSVLCYNRNILRENP